MPFKGSKNYEAVKVIAFKLDTMGAETNAFTDKDITGFHIKIPSNFALEGFKILADIVLNPLVRNKDTELERNVILEEYRDSLDDSSCILDELLHKHLFKGHNLSKSTIGIEKTINNIKASDIRKHHEKYYKLSEMGLVLVGNFPQEIHKHIKRLFSPKSKLYVPLVQTNFVFNCNVPNVIYKHKKDLNQTCISVVFSTVNFNESDKGILEFIGTYLGEGMSSRLFIELREKNSLVYTVEAEQCSYNTGGYFSIETQLKSKNIEKTISTIIKELELLKRGKISNEDIKKCKKLIEGDIKMDKSDLCNVAEHYNYQFLYGDKIETFSDYINKVKSINKERIKTIASKYFNNAFVFIVGKTTETTINNIKKLLHP